MGLPGAIGSQLMMKAQSDYATAVVVDRPFEFNSESITHDIVQLYSRGFGRGRVDATDRVKVVTRNHAGDIESDVMNKSFGLLFQHMLGQDTVTGSSANKTHTCVLDSVAQQGKFMTVQIGRADVAGTPEPFTYRGGKITKWDLSCALDQILKLKTSWSFAQVATNTALAAPSWPSAQEPFIFAEGAVTVGGSSKFAKSFRLSGDPKMVTDRRGIGNVMKEPLAGDFTEITGSLGCEFEDLTDWAAAIAGTQQALVITFTLATVIPTTVVPYSLTITCPKVLFTEAKPTVGGAGLIPLELPFRVLDDRTNPPVKFEYVTSDAAA